MLTPRYYDKLTDELIKLYSDLDNAIISDIVRRLLKTGDITDTARWQIQQLQESGMLYNDILSEISKRTDATQKQVRDIFEDAGVQSIKNDNIRYHAAGLGGIIKMSDSALQVLNAGYIKCSGNLSNLTLTTANTAQQAYITACNNAYMQVTSGAFDYNTAIRNAVKAAATEGTEVLYPSGHRDKLDVAVRRAVLTGVGQTCRTLSETNAQDIGCDLMEITAHAGARPSLYCARIDECSVFQSVKLRFQLCDLASEFCTVEKNLEKGLDIFLGLCFGTFRKIFQKRLDI